MKEKKQKKSSKIIREKNIISMGPVLIIMIIAVSCLTFVTFFELKRYEDGIIDVCASQQDGYVQLVIDQINLKENRTDEEIIESILSTLDSSSNRYWTFSKDQIMLYVKDALETNRYQSLTARSYYTSESADRFFNNLYINKVKHQRIILDNKDYIASGALFMYNGQEYGICLLTNTTVLLDNNKFLESKTELIIIFIVAYSLIFILPLAMVMLNNKVQRKNNKTYAELEEVNRTVEKLNEKLTTNEIYDNRLNLFQFSAISLFMDAYRDIYKAFPISFIAYRYGEKETVSDFFGHNCVLLGKKDIKFYEGNNHLVLLMCIQCDALNAADICRRIKADAVCLGIETSDWKSDFDECYKKIMDKMGNPDIGKISTNKKLRPDSRTESRYRTNTDKEI